MSLSEVHASTSLDALLATAVVDRRNDVPGTGRPRRHRPVRTAVVALLTTMAVLAGGVVSLAVYVEHRLTSNLERLPGVFGDPGDRPVPVSAGAAAEAVNILLLGTDRRSDVATSGSAAEAPLWLPGEQRSDTMMLLHIDADRRGAAVVSIPRDSWVEVPGNGPAKINAAFSWGGPHLAVQTFEALTDIYVDHVAVVDWDGFAALTDAAGGVDVTVPETVHDAARGITWTEGVHHLDGQAALAYVGQRYGLPGGDLDRVRRQQVFLRALMAASLHQEMRKDPRQLFGLLDTITRHVAVDSEWSVGEMRSLVLSLRDLRTADIRYLTAPVAGTGMRGVASVVVLDQTAGAALWAAVREDTLDDWVAAHPEAPTPAVVS